ncbi:hypothetical protein LZG04_21465 [Saccharothrix sp. S26]|uniref:hypothetical protein n=1 Tax=Saccharothrix sp. S26 TaxID=2907215 RepID=UPI001F441E4D|nr:hypothetical protein [Saccharothrix sp. S26]MCE6997350.1 hypothetical protein [Saccharothrix sp. S26]
MSRPQLRFSRAAVVLFSISLARQFVPGTGRLSATTWRGIPRIRCTPNFSPAVWM